MNVGQAILKAGPSLRVKTSQAVWISMMALGLALILGGFYAWQITSAQGAAVTTPVVETISAAALADRYGLQVSLIEVTSAGNMLDFRLKIVDADKAERLLSDSDKRPRLIVPDQGITLFASPTLGQTLNFEEGEEFYLLYGNRGGTVKPGTFVIVSFGEFQLERLPVE